MATTQINTVEHHAFAPMQGTQPAWLDDATYPFQSRFLNLEGHHIHYIDEHSDAGNAPTLLFLHANPLWSFQYRHMIEPLRARFRCVALDYPGFGLSEAWPGFVTTLAENSNLVEHFIRALDLSEITLVVHDASVSIGLGVVTRQTALFRALVISNGFAWPLSGDPAINRFLKVVASPLFRFLLVNFNLLLRTTVTNFGTLTDAERRGYLMPHADRSLRRHQHDFFRTIVNSHDYLSVLKSQLPTIAHFPALLLFADNDPTYKAGWMQRYAHIFPHHEAVQIEGSHHFPQEYNSEAMVQALMSWWDREMA